MLHLPPRSLFSPNSHAGRSCATTRLHASYAYELFPDHDANTNDDHFAVRHIGPVCCVFVCMSLPYHTHTPLRANARWRSCSTHSFDSLFVQSYDTYTLNPPNHRAASDCWHRRRGSLSDDQTKDTSSFPPLSLMELSGTPPPIFRALLKSTISWKGGGGGAFQVPTNSYVPGAQYTD